MRHAAAFRRHRVGVDAPSNRSISGSLSGSGDAIPRTGEASADPGLFGMESAS